MGEKIARTGAEMDQRFVAVGIGQLLAELVVHASRVVVDLNGFQHGVFGNHGHPNARNGGTGIEQQVAQFGTLMGYLKQMLVGDLAVGQVERGQRVGPLGGELKALGAVSLERHFQVDGGQRRTVLFQDGQQPVAHLATVLEFQLGQLGCRFDQGHQRLRRVAEADQRKRQRAALGTHPRRQSHFSSWRQGELA